MALGIHDEIGGGRTGALLLSVRGGLTTAINIAAARAAAPGWVSLPFGRYPNPVGMQVFDRQSAEQMATDFQTRLRHEQQGAPIFEGHPDDADWLQENPGRNRVPVGQITEMKPCADGLRLFCTVNGAPLTSTYTHFSPRWNMLPVQEGVYRPLSLLSIGLTNQPNISGAVFNPSFTHGVNVARKPTVAEYATAVAAIQAKEGIAHDDAWRHLRRIKPDMFR